MARLGLEPDVWMAAPDPDVGLVHHRSGEREVFFLANASRTEARDVEARFPTGDRRPWRWDAETGTRSAVPFSGKPDRLALRLEPLESLLLVYEPVTPRDPGRPETEAKPRAPIPAGERGGPAGSAPAALPRAPSKAGRDGLPVIAPWDVELRPAHAASFRRRVPQLFDLSLATADPDVADFGGTAVYRTEFDWTDETRTVLGLGTVHGISSVRLNGKDLGTRWWGRHLYDVRGALAKGRNVLEVEVTTTLGNRMRSLKDNPVAKSWSWWFPPIPMGLVGPVQLMKPSD
jgi:hypothetical protein